MIKIRRKIKTIALSIAGLLLCTVAVAQQNKFRYKADVGKVDSSGVYSIRLSPKFIARSTSKEFSDIRLMDESDRFVAYSVVDTSYVGSIQTFMLFSEVKQKIVSDSSAAYIADADKQGSISQLWLTFKNTAVDRLANLSGSDDLQHWYAIKEGIEIQGSADNSRTEYEQVLNFPRSNYRYYRVQMNNRKNDPVKIIRSGVYTSISPAPHTYRIKPIAVTAKDGQRKTSYFITFDDSFDLFSIQPIVSSVKPYNRAVNVYDIGKKDEQKIYEGRISSFSPPNFIPCQAKTNRVRIDIMNGDDSPLIFKDVVAWARRRYAVAFLEKGHQYYLLTGDSTASMVSYDLTFLHSKPLSQIPVISHSAVYKNPAFASFRVTVKHNYTPAIWGAIIVVLLILSLLTWRMIKELSSGPNE
jgi:hypothetical protein